MWVLLSVGSEIRGRLTEMNMIDRKGNAVVRGIYFGGLQFLHYCRLYAPSCVHLIQTIL